jgi:hypothetical protein
MKYLFAGQSKISDVAWLIELTKFDDPYVINAFIDHLVRGWPASMAASKNGLDQSNFNKALARLEQIEAHYQKRNNG